MAAAPKRARNAPMDVPGAGTDIEEITDIPCSGVIEQYTYTTSQWPKHKATIYLLSDNNATDPAKAQMVSWIRPGNWHGSWEETIDTLTGIRTLTLRFNCKWPVETQLRAAELTWTPEDPDPRKVTGVGRDSWHNVITMHKEAVWMRRNEQWYLQPQLGRATSTP